MDRLELVGAEFMRLVEEGFEELVRLEPERIMVLDAARPPEDLAEIVAGEILRFDYTRGEGDR